MPSFGQPSPKLGGLTSESRQAGRWPGHRLPEENHQVCDRTARLESAKPAGTELVSEAQGDKNVAIALLQVGECSSVEKIRRRSGGRTNSRQPKNRPREPHPPVVGPHGLSSHHQPPWSHVSRGFLLRRFSRATGVVGAALAVVSESFALCAQRLSSLIPCACFSLNPLLCFRGIPCTS